MKTGRMLSLLGFFLMLAALIYGFLSADFFGDGAIITGLAWGRVTLVDVYLGFLILVAWIWFHESAAVPRILWSLAILITGNLAAFLYLFLRMGRCRGDWEQFFLGDRRRK